MHIRWGNIFRNVLIAIIFISICSGIVSAEMTGSLKVIIEPFEVASESAAVWILSTDQYQNWYESGETNWNVPVGKGVLQFRQVPGWCTPPTRTIEISLGDNVEYGEYTQDSCDLTEDIRNIGCDEYLKKDIVQYSEVIYDFQTDCNIIENIRFKGLRNYKMIPLKIEMLKSTSTLVNYSVPQIVYKNFNVIIGSGSFLSENNVENLSITFSVEKSWIEQNDIMLDSINLSSFYGGTWNNYQTEKIDEDSTHIFFTSYPNIENWGSMAVSGQSNLKPISISAMPVQDSIISIIPPPESVENKGDGNLIALIFLFGITIVSYFILKSAPSE
jgi:PGF-pre-PGF domain-containing protein